MASKLIFFLLIISSLFIVSLQRQISTPTNNHNSISHFALSKSLIGCQKGDTVIGINMLKKYLERFGYLTHSRYNQLIDDDANNISYDNYFDEVTEAALKAYQLNHGLNPTGMTDNETLAIMSLPRCGIPDTINGGMSLNNKTYCHGTICIQFGSHYAFWGPKWPPSKYLLTFGFGGTFTQLGMDVISSAFAKWSNVSRFTFVEIKDYANADIQISFERLDHGDGHPFDGRGGVLGHAFPPTDGRLHFDGDESWSNGALAGSADLGTVGLHEIGHLLGLDHSKVEEAIMWAVIPYGITKEFHQDDIQGIQTLYQ